MPLVTLRIFVSSTWLDLQPERTAVEKALQRMQTTKFNGMEYFGSRADTPRAVSLKEVDRSQLYIGIFGGRYGSGITEDEYRRARELGLECKIYFKDESTITQFDEEPEKQARLEALKQELRQHLIGLPFTNPDELATQVATDLHNWIINEFLPAQQQTLAYRALHQLPAPPLDFTGRAEELAELRQHCQRGLTISGVQGMGGVGKTALALKLADELKPAYPDAQFYLDLQGVSEQPLTSAQAMAYVIRAYHPENKLPDDDNALGALYRSVLDQQKALLLLDNAKDAAQVAPLVPPPGCLLLVTSRQHFGLPGFHAIPLDSLTPADARLLLLKIEPRIGEAADELAELCGRLPLALELAAQALKTRTNLTPADYARRLREAESRLDVLDKTDFPRKIKAAISSSYDLLSTEQQKLWRALAVFPGSFDHLAAAAVWDMKADDAQDKLGELMDFSLVEFSKLEDRCRLHDLARVFLTECISKAEQTSVSVKHAEYFYNVLRSIEEVLLQRKDSIKTGLFLYDLERYNIEEAIRWSALNSDLDNKAHTLCARFPLVGSHTLSLCLANRQWIQLLEVGLIAAKKTKEQWLISTHLCNLGLAYYTGNIIPKAYRTLKKALALALKLGDRCGQANVFCNLGNVYEAMGDEYKAIDNFEKALLIHREEKRQDHEITDLCNIAFAYTKLRQLDTAIKYIRHYRE